MTWAALYPGDQIIDELRETDLGIGKESPVNSSLRSLTIMQLLHIVLSSLPVASCARPAFYACTAEVRRKIRIEARCD